MAYYGQAPAIDGGPGPLVNGGDVACARCGRIMETGEIVLSLPVFDADGALDYVEIAHLVCDVDVDGRNADAIRRQYGDLVRSARRPLRKPRG